MILEIKNYPNPVLKRRSEEVKEITPEIKELASDMTETMKSREGVGIAAPQLGLLKRLIVVQMEKGPEAFVNPEILRKSKEQEIMEEGCFCLPGIFLKIKRAKEAEIEALDINGNKIRIKTGGFPARIFQHEIDHLDGILFIDRAGVGRKIWESVKFYIRRRK
jgi:peptide deformylase